jgi:hypothetical protein
VADLVVIQPGQAFAGLEVLLDGLITNGKFCCVRRGVAGLDLVTQAAAFARICSPDRCCPGRRAQ